MTFLKTFFYLLLLGVCIVPQHATAQEFEAFSGTKIGWYFSLLSQTPPTSVFAKELSISHRLIGVRGPFSTEKQCVQQAERLKATSDCYERETLDYYRWKQKKARAWVLPLQTGDEARLLVFHERAHCHRVATSGYYVSSTQVKVPLVSDLRRCTLNRIPFGEYEKPYAFLDAHSLTTDPFPKFYQAWSLPVEDGTYRRLLQFPGKDDYARAACILVQKAGVYYREIPDKVGSIIVEVPIVSNETCQKRAPLAGEIPSLYMHLDQHDFSKDALSQLQKPKLVEETKPAWVLHVRKQKGAPEAVLFFQEKSHCRKVLIDGFYYSRIPRGGLAGDRKFKVWFEEAKPCSLVDVPESSKWYSFLEEH